MKNFGFFAVIVIVLFSTTLSFAGDDSWTSVMPGALYTNGTCRMELQNDNAIFSFTENVGDECHMVQRTLFDTDTGEKFVGYATTFLRNGKLLYQPTVIDGDLFITNCCGFLVPDDVPEKLHDAYRLYCEPAVQQ